jgi:hypothetical protein
MNVPDEIKLGPALVARHFKLNNLVHGWDVFDGTKRIGQVVLAQCNDPQGWVVINIYCLVKGVMRILLPILTEYCRVLMSSRVIGGDTSLEAARMWQGLNAAVCHGPYGLYFQLHAIKS